MSKTLRNVGIIVAAAALIAFLPGGGDGAGVVMALLQTGIGLMFVLLAVRFYRENRVAIFSLGDRHRALLYGAIGAVVIALAGSRKLLDTGVGSLVFVVLLLGAAGAGYAVWQHHRAYGY